VRDPRRRAHPPLPAGYLGKAAVLENERYREAQPHEAQGTINGPKNGSRESKRKTTPDPSSCETFRWMHRRSRPMPYEILSRRHSCMETVDVRTRGKMVRAASSLVLHARGERIEPLVYMVSRAKITGPVPSRREIKDWGERQPSAESFA